MSNPRIPHQCNTGNTGDEFRRGRLNVPNGLEVLPAIRQLLTDAGVSFREVRHEPTRTSEESANARGEELRIGGKALLMKGDDLFRLFVLPADRKLDSGAIRREFGWKKLRFATPEELHERTGLVPGSVPPFGSPIMPFELCLDQAATMNPRIAFNAGSLTDSIILAMPDYLAIAKPTHVFAFSLQECPSKIHETSDRA
jgi:prolyl-tRNA editing enzyme YbaK/EbsC (Cys-tRNA(Pro) deacylase)